MRKLDFSDLDTQAVIIGIAIGIPITLWLLGGIAVICGFYLLFSVITVLTLFVLAALIAAFRWLANNASD